MGLIDKLDETKLRSLKFGVDTPGGSSDKPYIVTNLEDVDRDINRLRFTKFDDGLVRGGSIGALNAALTDTLRIGKFLVDNPKGPLFITKQVGLQLSNPKLETAKVPEGGGFLGFAGKILNTITDKTGIGPTRIYNLGINTLAQVPLTAAGGHIVRHGLSPIHDDNTNYINIVKNNNVVNDDGSSANRLVTLKDKLHILSPISPKVSLQNNVAVSARKEGIETIIDSYWGGPGSTYGIGTTLLNRYDNTTNLRDKLQLQYQTQDLLEVKLSNVNWFSTQGLSTIYFSGKETLKIGSDVLGIYNDLDQNNPTKASRNVAQPALSADSLQDNLKGQMKNLIFNKGGGLNGVSDSVEQVSFQRGDDGKMVTLNTAIGYSDNQIEYKNSYGEEIKLGKTYATFNREKRVGSGRLDSINKIPLIYDSKPLNRITIPEAGELSTRDLIKFRFEAIDTEAPDNSVWMYFRSYLKSFKDSYSADWDKKKYYGRGESFYRYNGADRDISFSFKVAALSKEEMEPMYQKLNFLVSNMYPDYSLQGLMRGPVMRLTVGNYIYREPGVIKSLTYEISDETPWEIAINEPEGGLMMYELPHIIDVNISFSPIHNFLPQKSISDSPFIMNKVEEEVTGQGAEKIDNPWLKQRANGRYTDNPLTAFNEKGKYTEHKK